MEQMLSTLRLDFVRTIENLTETLPSLDWKKEDFVSLSN